MLTWKDIIHFTLNGNPIPDFRIDKTELEWKNLLDKATYEVTRKKGTETPFSGEHCSSYQEGIYKCSNCNTLLFDSTIKFDSKSGWPSFTQPIKPNAIKYNRDDSHGMIRVEILCNSCDAHLGHVFPDGPPPCGLRYCVNSLSLKLERNE